VAPRRVTPSQVSDGVAVSALTFLREFVRSPSSLGSVTPSSASLARFVVDTAHVRPDHHVVEIGAGTGPVTRELSDRLGGRPFLSLEPNGDLAQVVRERVPSAEVVEAFAQELPSLLQERNLPLADRVISGLPFTVWPEELQDDIFASIVEAMAPTGRFVTFTYVVAHFMPGSKVLRRCMRRRFEHVSRSRVLWANMPPAYVFVGEGPIK